MEVNVKNCKYIDSFCRLNFEDMSPEDCRNCIIKLAYDNGVKQGYHESEMWDRCPPQGSHIEYPNDGNYR